MHKTLHEVMKEIITEHGRMKAVSLKRMINETGLYLKRDGSELETSQIYGRIHQYPEMFYRDDQKRICLR